MAATITALCGTEPLPTRNVKPLLHNWMEECESFGKGKQLELEDAEQLIKNALNQGELSDKDITEQLRNLVAKRIYRKTDLSNGPQMDVHLFFEGVLKDFTLTKTSDGRAKTELLIRVPYRIQGISMEKPKIRLFIMTGCHGEFLILTDDIEVNHMIRGTSDEFEKSTKKAVSRAWNAIKEVLKGMDQVAGRRTQFRVEEPEESYLFCAHYEVCLKEICNGMDAKHAAEQLLEDRHANVYKGELRKRICDIFARTYNMDFEQFDHLSNTLRYFSRNLQIDDLDISKSFVCREQTRLKRQKPFNDTEGFDFDSDPLMKDPSLLSPFDI